jgi:REP-associated tyrosine transposase
MRTILGVLRAVRGRFGLRVVQFVVLADHLHLLIEADGAAGLSRGMRVLCTRLAIHLNRELGRKGKLFGDRYHARALGSPLEVRHGLVYVLNNYRRHCASAGRVLAARWVDPCSSGPSFDGWRAPPIDLPRREIDLGTSRPRTWLLRSGWRRHGLLELDEIPGGGALRRAVQKPPSERAA